jgi:hypothetical protein
MSKKSPEYKRNRAKRVKAKLTRLRLKREQEKKQENIIQKLKRQFSEKVRPIRNYLA